MLVVWQADTGSMSHPNVTDHPHSEHHGNLPCLDCGRSTCDLDEYYMVHDHVWQTCGLDTHDGCLCVGCLEQRLGRELAPRDFTPCPLNQGGFCKQSERLLNRLGDVAWMAAETERYFASLHATA